MFAKLSDMSRNTKCRAMAIVPSNYILLRVLQIVVRNVGFKLTAANVDDRKPVPDMHKTCSGSCLASASMFPKNCSRNSMNRV